MKIDFLTMTALALPLLFPHGAHSEDADSPEEALLCQSEQKEGSRPLLSVIVSKVDTGSEKKYLALATDLRISRLPLAFICEKSTMENDGQVFSSYLCLGGGYNEEKDMALAMNETTSEANYFFDNTDQDEEYDLEGLKCETFLPGEDEDTQ